MGRFGTNRLVIAPMQCSGHEASGHFQHRNKWRRQKWQLLLQVADLVGADPKEIIFTSGATESNNLALKGVANFYRDRKKHIITTQTDHK